MNEMELRTALEHQHTAAYGWALCCCRQDPAMAEEVLQQAYFKVLSGRARFGARAGFQTWLFAVIRKTAADERRRQMWRQWRLDRLWQWRLLPAQAPSPTDQLEQQERHAWLRQALRRLPRRQTEVLHLVFYQDLSLAEAARVMGVSVGAARRHYERAKLRLRQWAETDCKAYEPDTLRAPTPQAVR